MGGVFRERRQGVGRVDGGLAASLLYVHARGQLSRESHIPLIRTPWGREGGRRRRGLVNLEAPACGWIVGSYNLSSVAAS